MRLISIETLSCSNTTLSLFQNQFASVGKKIPSLTGTFQSPIHL